MKKVEMWALDFHTQQLTQLIAEKYSLDEKLALKRFLFSQTYQMLLDPNTALYAESPYFLMDMWECEQITGEPRNSLYIRAEH